MAYEIKNKIVLITGGASGIGALVVRNLINEEAKFVAVLDIDEKMGVSLQEELISKCDSDRVRFIKCDVSVEQQLLGAYQMVLDENGYIDIVINNAGIMNDAVNIYKKSIEVNYIALVTSTLRALETMRRDHGGNGGAVLNIASIAALCQDPLMPVYFGSKSAVLQFSNCLGMPKYYSKTGVRIVTVCFGATNTPILTMAKLGSFDKEQEHHLMDDLKAFPIQRPESAALGVIEVLKRGDNGSTWLATNDDPVKNITATVKKAYSILANEVFH